jgi:hypothetical protein
MQVLSWARLGIPDAQARAKWSRSIEALEALLYGPDFWVCERSGDRA